MDFWKDSPASWVPQRGVKAEQQPEGSLKPHLWAELSTAERALCCAVLADLESDVMLNRGNFAAKLLEQIRRRGDEAREQNEQTQLGRLERAVSQHLDAIDDLHDRWRALKPIAPAANAQ